MDEYISKQAILEHLNDCKEDPLFDEDMARICFAIGIFIGNMKTADVQQVVHCKDCKYAQNPNDTMVYCTYFECGTMSQNDFCSQGERSC